MHLQEGILMDTTKEVEHSGPLAAIGDRFKICGCLYLGMAVPWPIWRSLALASLSACDMGNPGMWLSWDCHRYELSRCPAGQYLQASFLGLCSVTPHWPGAHRVIFWNKSIEGNWAELRPLSPPGFCLLLTLPLSFHTQFEASSVFLFFLFKVAAWR